MWSIAWWNEEYVRRFPAFTRMDPYADLEASGARLTRARRGATAAALAIAADHSNLTSLTVCPLRCT